REDRAGPELEVRNALVEDRRAGHVRRHQVGRELDAAELHARDLRERARNQRLREAGEVLDQDVAVREQPEQDELERVTFADDRPLDLVEDPRRRPADVLERELRRAWGHGSASTASSACATAERRTPGA